MTQWIEMSKWEIIVLEEANHFKKTHMRKTFSYRTFSHYNEEYKKTTIGSRYESCLVKYEASE